MPEVDATPKEVKPYLAHGLEIRWREGDDNATGDCPFCGREGKLSVSLRDGTAHCWACTINPDSETGKGGVNHLSFIRVLWGRSVESTTSDDHRELAAERGLLYHETLEHWGVARSITNGEWLVPGFDAAGKLCQLYRWSVDHKSALRLGGGAAGTGKHVLKATPGLGHGLMRPDDWDDAKEVVHAAEGPWDGMAWWEVLRSAKVDADGNLSPTASNSASLLANVNVVALPGTGSIGKPLVRVSPAFADKKLVLLFDSDHPRFVCKDAACGESWSPVEYGRECPACGGPPSTKEPQEGAGFAAVKRAAAVLGQVEKRPSGVEYLKWGDGGKESSEFGEGFDPLLKSGYDIRDALKAAGGELVDRLPIVADLLGRITEVPGGWTPAVRKKAKGGEVKAEGQIHPKPCREWKTVINAWRRALFMRSSMEDTLAVMLAVALSTRRSGDQLFLRVIGDPGSAKTRFCDALLVSKSCKLVEQITGMYSGWSDGSGKDFSFLSRSNNMTWITPEADTMIASPDYRKLMAEMRRIFDGKTSATFKNSDVDLVWDALRTPWIMAGTPSILDGDQSRLGDRFLKVWIDRPSEEEKEDILEAVCFSAFREVRQEANCSAESMMEKDLLEAFQLTGGYVDWLREHHSAIINAVEFDVREVAKKCSAMANLSAALRSRPSEENRKGDSHDVEELPSRLAKQLCRLAACLAAVYNKRTIDAEVLRVVRKVAIDTGRGRTLDIVRHLIKKGDDGESLETLSVLANETAGKENVFLRYLRRIKVVELFDFKSGGVKVAKRWRLTPRIRKLWKEVFQDA